MMNPQTQDEEMQRLLAQIMGDAQFMQLMQARGQDPSKFSKEELTAIYRDYKGERKSLDNQMAYANELRTQALPQGRSAGGVYRASGALENLAGLANRAVGEFRAKDVREQEKQLSQAEALGRQASGRELAAAVRGSQPQPQPQAPSGPTKRYLTPEEEEMMRRQRMGMRSA